MSPHKPAVEPNRCLNRVVDAGLANGRAPEGVAAGALLCAAPDAELSSGELEDVTSVTDATIYNRRAEFRELT